MSSLPARQAQEPSERLLRINVTLKGRPIRSYVFTKDQVVIGRNPTADLFLDNPGVSRDHLRLERSRNGDYVLQDVGSANGTLLNDQPVTSTRLQDQDVIQIGKFSLHVSYEEDRRRTDAERNIPMPTADEGTMVLSTADLQEMVKKAHEAESKAAKGALGPLGPHAQMLAARRNHVYAFWMFVLGTVIGAAGTYWVLHLLKR